MSRATSDGAPIVRGRRRGKGLRGRAARERKRALSLQPRQGQSLRDFLAREADRPTDRRRSA